MEESEIGLCHLTYSILSTIDSSPRYGWHFCQLCNLSQLVARFKVVERADKRENAHCSYANVLLMKVARLEGQAICLGF